MTEKISIHALREEGDQKIHGSPYQSLNFNPRPPRGGRHGVYFMTNEQMAISIHALREEGDRDLPENAPGCS